MNQGQYQQYQKVSKLYQQIVDTITKQELPQIKLYLINLDKRIAAKQNQILAEYDSVKSLLNNFKEAKGKVILHFSAAKGNLDIFRHLVQSLGLDSSVRDKQGNSPFFTAIEHGHFELVKYFVEELNSSPNECKEGEISALHIASNHNHVSIIQYLIAKNADIERVSIFGKPINWAVGNRHIQATSILLDHGADPNGDSTGTNPAPLILAVDFRLKEIYNTLIQKGASISIKDPHGYSVLHVAAQKGDLQIVKDLVQRGADVNLQVQGKSPLYLAFDNGKWDVVAFLKTKSPNFAQIQAIIQAENQKKKQQVSKPTNPQRAEQIKNIGNKFYAEKKYEEALIQYKHALEEDPTHEVVHRNMAACYLALNQYQEALVHCHHASQKDKKNVKTLYRESQAYKGLGDLIQAASKMWECCLLQPSNGFFRTQFQKLMEEGKAKHQQSSNTQ